MMKRRQFTPEFKLQCVLDIISGRKRPVEILREHNISDSLLTRWRQQFTEQAPRIFEPQKQRNSAQVQRIAELERLVGRLTLQLEASKKLSSYFSSG
jgi:transposase-like protein